MRIRLALLAAVALLSAGCVTSIKKDPNLVELTASAERQNEQTLEHERLLAEQQRKDQAECMTASTAGAMAICFLGKTSITLANGRGGSGSGLRQPNLPAYTPPPTGVQQFAQFMGAVSPLAQTVVSGAVSWDATRQANITTRYVSAQNTQREVYTVEAMAGVSTAIANQAPGIQLGEGAVYSLGPVTQIGGNNAGGHYNESGTLIADSDDATLGVRQGDNGVNGNDNTVRHDSPDIIDSGNCTAGNGGPGAAGAAGGLGGASSGGAGGPGAPGGSGGPGGNCTPAPLPPIPPIP